jgi:hypothetical protein
MHVRRMMVTSVFLIILTGIVYAAAFNFGSMQKMKSISLEPGEEGELLLYFFNIYGDRITHIKLELTSYPEGWEVEIEPPIHEQQVEVQGRVITVTENLYVEPSKPVPEKPEQVPEGMEYLVSGKVEGFIPAKVVKIKVKVPKDAELWKEYPINVRGTAFWLGEGGNVALNQQRNFAFTVKTIKREYTERIITEEEKGIKPEYIAVVAVILFAAIFLLRRRR